MSTDIGVSDAPYNTQIPTLQDNADIQAALRMYHYGSNTDNPDPIIANSIVGHLSALEANKFNKAVTAISGSGTNLNTYQTTGWYVQSSQTNARSGSNYPTFKLTDGDASPLAYAGMLEVVFDGAVIYQTYHALLTTTPTKTALAWRAYFAGAWSSWRVAADDQHNHDTRYYVKYGVTSSDKSTSIYNATQVDSAISAVSTAKVSKGGTNEATTIYVRDADPVLVNGKAVPAGNPTPANGDLWFW